MARIVIVGAGVMGSAFSVPLADNGHTVRLVGTHLDEAIIAAIRQRHAHPRLRVHLPGSVSPFTQDQLADALRDADLVVLAVSSAGVDWAAERFKASLPAEVPIVMLTKGLRGDGQMVHTLPAFLQDQLRPRYRSQVGAIGGPSIAAELAVRRETSVTLAIPDRELGQRLARWLRTPYYHVWPDTDVVGVEVCAALKNAYALGVGLAAGMLEGTTAAENEARMHNTAAALFAQALWEMAYVAGVCGGQPRAVWTLAGCGDLYVTCQAGRNYRMGRWLGLGVRYSEAKALHMNEDTVEGGETARAIGPTINGMIERGALDRAGLPLLLAIVTMVCRDELPPIPWERFFATPFAEGQQVSQPPLELPG